MRWGYRVLNRHLMARPLAVALALLCLTAPDIASAQGLLDMLFGGFRRPSGSLPSGAQPYADPNGVPGQQAAVPGGETGGRSAAFCVRTCDGRFFPISRQSGATNIQVCKSLCPASPTKVFSGSQISHASAPDGSRYADLDNAFVYREKVIPGCTCNGKDAFGLAPLDAANDPTLRAGDIVATQDGLMSYRGRNAINQTAEFSPVDNSSGLAPDMRRRLSDTKILPTGTASAAPVAVPAPVAVMPAVRNNSRPRSAQLDR
jgi:hypothetical protein